MSKKYKVCPIFVMVQFVCLMYLPFIDKKQRESEKIRQVIMTSYGGRASYFKSLISNISMNTVYFLSFLANNYILMISICHQDSSSFSCKREIRCLTFEARDDFHLCALCTYVDIAQCDDRHMTCSFQAFTFSK